MLRRPMIRRLFPFALVLALAAVAAAAPPSLAAGRKPLLMDGKQNLFRKVLTRPEAALAAKPGQADGKALDPFSVLFVYGEQTAGGEAWLEVGPSRDGTVSGWVAAASVIPWNQTMTAAFTNPAGRDRTLMFRTRKALEDTLVSADLLIQADEYREAIEKGTLASDGPIVSIEPKNAVDLGKSFYLMPILEAEEVYLDTGYPVTMVNVASVTAPEAGTVTPPDALPPPPPDDLRSAVVFVIDATTSMGPYIQRTKEMMKSIYAQVEAAGVADKVRFGIVAYRDSTKAAPGLEYVSRVFVDPNEVKDGKAFLKAVEGLQPSKVSSQGFQEDAMAGVNTALTDIDWSTFDGRFVVLVTDAPAREGSDPLSATGLAPAQMNQMAARNNVFVYAMHLLTDAGKGNHALAAQQYKALTRYADAGRDLYFPVRAGDVNAFGAQVDRLAEALVAQVKRGPDLAAQAAEVEKKRKALDQAKTAEEKAQRELDYEAELVGLAIQMRYFGAKEGTAVPSVFDAWMTDRDFRDPDVPTLDVRVLLTKNQLSDLAEALQRVIEAGEAGQLAPQDFFSQLQAAAAAMGRDPDRIKSAATIAELGLIGEYLDGLPYRSKVMSVDQDLWLSWGVGQQQQFIDELRSKVALYRRYHDEPANWILLAEGAQPGDAVYPVRLDELP